MTNFQKLYVLVSILAIVIFVNHWSNQNDKVREAKFDNCMNIVKEENMATDYQVEFLTKCMDK
jgi:predicted metal-dependent hydrolase